MFRIKFERDHRPDMTDPLGPGLDILRVWVKLWRLSITIAWLTPRAL